MENCLQSVLDWLLTDTINISSVLPSPQAQILSLLVTRPALSWWSDQVSKPVLTSPHHHPWFISLPSLIYYKIGDRLTLSSVIMWLCDASYPTYIYYSVLRLRQRGRTFNCWANNFEILLPLPGCWDSTVLPQSLVTPHICYEMSGALPTPIICWTRPCWLDWYCQLRQQ